MESKPHAGVMPQQHSAATAEGKRVIKAVVGHDRLLAEIEARNPIIANRQTRKPVRPSSASNR